MPGETFRGEIDHLRMTMDPQTRTQAVVIAVDNPGGRLRPGMFGRVRISVEVAKEAIVCPVDAVIRSRTGNYLLVQRMPGKYENRPVKLGLTEDGQIEVLDGVFPGDQVVVVGNSLLAALLGNEHKARVDGTEPRAGGQRRTKASSRSPTVPSNCRPTSRPWRRRRSRAASAASSSSPANTSRRARCWPRSTASNCDRSSWICCRRSLRRGWSSSRSSVWKSCTTRASWRSGSGGNCRASTRRCGRRPRRFERQLAYFGLEPRSHREAQAGRSVASRFVGRVGADRAGPRPGGRPDRRFSCRAGPGRSSRGAAVRDPRSVDGVGKGFVYERDANRVQLGQPAHVHFAAYPDLEANGKVVRISPLMHENMRVLPVWVEVSNPDHLLKSGMLARMTIMDESAGEGRVRGRGPASLASNPPGK